jgi:LysM repeat protein
MAAAVVAPTASADGTPVKSPAPSASAKPSGQPAVRTHTVQPGETMWSVAHRHGVAVSDVARASGRPSDTPLAVGTELKLPPPGPPPGGNGRLPFSQQVPIHSPRGPAYLAPEPARAWEAMREASLHELGVDLYPFGPDSAYRSYGKQVEAWRVFQAGGPEAAPPGTSAHGLGKAVDLASLEMRKAVDKLGHRFGWAKTEAPSEWRHINYVGG